MKFILSLLFVTLALARVQAEPLEVTDVDGKQVVLNRKGGVTAVVYSNAALQNYTRENAKFFDPFQGRKAFRGIVVVDLRKSLAGWMKGVTLGIIRKDLESESKRVKPSYIRNGNTGNPRDDLGVVADFKGEVCQMLGWDKELKAVEIIIFGPDGKEAGRWQNSKNPEEIQITVDKLLDALEKK